MVVFEWILLMLTGAVVLSAIANRIKVPYPVLLAVGGAAVAFLPHGPQFALDPALALALFVAPMLLDAAYDTSLRDLKEAWFTVGLLVVVAVCATAGAVAVVAHWLVPDMPWAAAIALGAIVAPPDAGAATAVLRQIRLPLRLMTVLEGESLLNDASSLLIYRIAVITVAGEMTGWQLTAYAALVVPLSILLGAAVAVVYPRILIRIESVPTQIVMQFVGVFGLWLLAEKLHLSAILAVVVFGIMIARNMGAYMPARIRVPSFAVWEVVVFVLNVLAFLIVGLQLRPILSPLSVPERWEYFGVAGAVLLTCILVRIAVVMPYNFLYRRHYAKGGLSNVSILYAPTVATGSIIAWCGMRGIVTLAAALALPDGFPYRDLITLCAFAVVLGTLLIQGLTIRPLLAFLKLREDDSLERETNLARCAALRAGLAAIDGDQSPAGRALRDEFNETLSRATETPDHRLPKRLAGDEVRQRALTASRKVLLDMRDNGKIGDAAFHKLEEEFDWLELATGEKD